MSIDTSKTITDGRFPTLAGLKSNIEHQTAIVQELKKELEKQQSLLQELQHEADRLHDSIISTIS